MTQVDTELRRLLGAERFMEATTLVLRSLGPEIPIGEMPRVEACDGESPAIPAALCAAEAAPTSPAICQTIEIPRTTPEVRDGHGLHPAIPLIFQH